MNNTLFTRELALFTSFKASEIRTGNTYEVQYIVPQGIAKDVKASTISVISVKKRLGNCITVSGLIKGLDGTRLCHIRCNTPHLSSDVIKANDIVLLTHNDISDIKVGHTFTAEYISSKGIATSSRKYVVFVEKIIYESGKHLTCYGIIDELEGHYLCHVRCNVPLH